MWKHSKLSVRKINRKTIKMISERRKWMNVILVGVGFLVMYIGNRLIFLIWYNKFFKVKKSIYLRLWNSKSSVTNSLRQLLLLSSSKNYCQRTGSDGFIKVLQALNRNINHEKKFQINTVYFCLDFPFNNFTDRSEKMHAHRINNEYNLLRNVS